MNKNIRAIRHFAITSLLTGLAVVAATLLQGILDTKEHNPNGSFSTFPMNTNMTFTANIIYGSYNSTPGPIVSIYYVPLGR